MTGFFSSLLAACALLTALSPGAAQAQSARKDAQILVRALGFLQTPPSGEVLVAILHDPANAASKAEAEALLAGVAETTSVAGVSLKAKLVPVGGKLDGVGAVYLSAGVEAALDGVARLTVSGKLPCFTKTLDYVSGGKCLAGVKSEPRVEFFVSRAASDASGVAFNQAFRVMAREM